MRTPNPPRVYLDDLTPESRRKVVKLALLVVAALSSGRDWDALGEIEMADLTLEEKLAFGSCLNSQQASTIVSLRSVSDKPGRDI